MKMKDTKKDVIQFCQSHPKPRDHGGEQEGWG